MADPIIQLCQIIVEMLRDEPELEQAELMARVEGAIAENLQLTAAFRSTPQILQTNQDESKGFQTVVENGTVYIGGTQVVLPDQGIFSESEKYKAGLEAVLRKLQIPKAGGGDFSECLESSLSDRVSDYLLSLENLIDTTAPIYASTMPLSMLYQEQYVVQQQMSPSTLTSELKRWADIYDAAQRVLIQGEAGAGKTLLARMTLQYIAKRALAEGVSKGKTLKNTFLPIMVPLVLVAEQGLKPVLREMARCIANPLNPQDALQSEVELLVRHFLSDHGWLILDGLDEVSDYRNRLRLKTNLIDLVPAKCHVLVTCRVSESYIALFPFSFNQKFDLQSFTKEQKNKFVSTYFCGDPKLLVSAKGILLGSKEEAVLSENPLLLTLTCYVIKCVHNLDKITRVTLYRNIVDLLLTSKWSESGYVLLAEAYSVISNVTLNLFRMKRAYAFTNTEWQLATRNIKNFNGDADHLLEDLCYSGLIEQKGILMYQFVHRSVADFLAADALSKKEDYISILQSLLLCMDEDEEIFFRIENFEMARMLAECLLDPNPLIEFLVDFDKGLMINLCPHLLFLAGRCVNRSRLSNVRSDLRERVNRELLRCLDNSIVPHEDIVSSFGMEELTKILSNHEDDKVRELAVSTLRADGSFALCRNLILSLAQTDPSFMVRQTAAEWLIEEKDWHFLLTSIQSLRERKWSEASSFISWLSARRPNEAMHLTAYPNNASEKDAAREEGKPWIYSSSNHELFIPLLFANSFSPLPAIVFLIDGGTEDGSGFSFSDSFNREYAFLLSDNLDTVVQVKTENIGYHIESFTEEFQFQIENLSDLVAKELHFSETDIKELAKIQVLNSNELINLLNSSSPIARIAAARLLFTDSKSETNTALVELLLNDCNTDAWKAAFLAAIEVGIQADHVGVCITSKKHAKPEPEFKLQGIAETDILKILNNQDASESLRLVAAKEIIARYPGKIRVLIGLVKNWEQGEEFRVQLIKLLSDSVLDDEFINVLILCFTNSDEPDAVRRKALEGAARATSMEDARLFEGALHMLHSVEEEESLRLFVAKTLQEHTVQRDLQKRVIQSFERLVGERMWELEHRQEELDSGLPARCLALIDLTPLYYRLMKTSGYAGRERDNTEDEDQGN